MKLKALVLGAMLLCAAGVSHAQSTSLGLIGGLGVPTGDFSDAANTGYYVGANGAYMFNQQFGIGVDLAYHGWAGSDDLNAATDALLGTTGSEWTWSAIQATPHLIVAVPSEGTVRPWFKAGAGLYNLKGKLETPLGDDDDSESKFGFNVGLGFDYRNTDAFGIGVDAAYHMIPEDNGDVSLFTVGLHWTWSMTK